MTDETLEQILKRALVPEIDEAEIAVHRKEEDTYLGKGEKGKRKINKNIAAAAIAMAIMIIGGSSVYAAINHFGLLDFTENRREQIPQEATQLIEKNVEQTISEDTEDMPIHCEVKEALCDSETIMIVYEVTAKEQGKYLFIPEDAVATDDMSDWSDIRGITAGEYAKQNGLSILHIGGGITNLEELGIAESSLAFHSASDDVMAVYIRSGKQSDAKRVDVECVATAWADGTGTVCRREMKFTLEDLAKAETCSYQPEKSGSTEAKTNLEILGAEVIQTELGTYVDITFRAENEAAETLTFRIKDADGRLLDSLGGSGIESHDDGTLGERLSMNRTELGESFVVEIYDYISNVTRGSVRMKRR